MYEDPENRCVNEIVLRLGGLLFVQNIKLVQSKTHLPEPVEFLKILGVNEDLFIYSNSIYNLPFLRRFKEEMFNHLTLPHTL